MSATEWKCPQCGASGHAVLPGKKLRDCRGFVDTIDELCTCGGASEPNACTACKIFHAIGDWIVVNESATSATSATKGTE